MSYGLLIKGQAGYTQIDQNYSNYIVWQTGFCNMTDAGFSSPDGSFACRGSISYSLPVKPLVFIRHISSGTFISLHDLSETSAGFMATYSDRASFSFEYAICIPVNHAGASAQNFGLRVFGAVGLVFDYGRRHPRITGTFSYTPYVDGFNGGYFTVSIREFVTSTSNPWISVNCRALSPPVPFFGSSYSVQTCGVSCAGNSTVRVNNNCFQGSTLTGSMPSQSSGPYSMCVASAL